MTVEGLNFGPSTVSVSLVHALSPSPSPSPSPFPPRPTGAEGQPLPWHDGGVQEGHAGQEPQPHGQEVPQRLQFLPPHLVPASRVRYTFNSHQLIKQMLFIQVGLVKELSYSFDVHVIREQVRGHSS